MAYYFDGSDGCPACEAKTGVYKEEPDRPHIKCECDIEPVDDEDGPWDPALYVAGRPCTDDKGYEHPSTTRDEGNPNGGFWITVTVWVLCCDGDRYEEEYGHHFDEPHELDDVEEEMENGISELQGDLSVDNCVPEEPEVPTRTDPMDDFAFV